MIPSEIENSIIKYLTKSANVSDLDRLGEWIQNPKNHPVFEAYIKTHYTILFGMNTPDPSEIRKRLLKEIRKHKKPLYRLKIKTVLKYVAIAVLFIGMGYFYQQEQVNSKKRPLILPKQEAITLQLSDGTIDTLAENGTLQIRNVLGKLVGRQHKNQLEYQEKSEAIKLHYNTLQVPYGKRFKIKLSDGTVVHLNSGSSLKYPVAFLAVQNREVFLKGEAYFKVAKNKRQPFIVKAEALNIQVTGTQFNVSAYTEDATTDVVLVEGSVGLYKKGDSLPSKNTVLLRPHFKASFDKAEKTIHTHSVNTKIYTSWINGTEVFRKAPFSTIVKKLERFYNVTIINNNEALAKETFNASITIASEPIEKVLSYFDKIYGIKYTIINNKIVINKPKP